MLNTRLTQVSSLVGLIRTCGHPRYVHVEPYALCAPRAWSETLASLVVNSSEKCHRTFEMRLFALSRVRACVHFRFAVVQVGLMECSCFRLECVSVVALVAVIELFCFLEMDLGSI